ncbi:MAG: HEAT repeat domain-containing protein [Pyrinomonadaceae bacterium]|nr:HEAT repeat domain-containing protein [Sphingobacteriaceae bacterium]
MFLTPQHILFATLFFSVFMITLLVFIIIALIVKNKREKNQIIWEPKIDILITESIFFDDEESKEFYIPINKKITALLKKTFFRKTLIHQLVLSARNISGTSANNLGLLYLQLGLAKDSLANLKNSLWHKKAKAIQELATMQQLEFSPRLYKLINHKNEYIRMEAQISMIKFHGFDGLDFLDEITYPLSEWHQINILKELAFLAAANFKGIGNWLKSKNDSVIVFALKLCATYHQFDLYDKIADCLEHTNPKVRLQAIRCLKEIYVDTTARQLIRIYQSQPKIHQLAILKALQEIAAPESLSFLENQLFSDDNQIKLEAARALYKCGLEGEILLNSHPEANLYPLNEIIQQIKMEI